MSAATTFAYITDPQFSTDRPEDPWYSRRIVRWLNNVQQCKWPAGTSCAGEPVGDLAGVFVAGDLSQQGGYRPVPWEGRNSSIFLTFRDIYERNLNWPVYMGLGNHDCEECTVTWMEWRITIPNWYRDYMWQYINQMHYGTAKSPAIRPVTNIDAYSFLKLGVPSWKEWSFNYYVEYEHVVVFQLHRYGGDAHYGRAPGNDWLKDQLKSIGTDKPIIIVQHMGWTDLCNPDNPDCGEQSWPWTQADALLTRLKGYNVIAVLRGHDHGQLGMLDVTYTDGSMAGFKEYIPGSGCCNVGGGENPDKIDAALFLPSNGAIQTLCYFQGPHVIAYGGSIPWTRDKCNSFEQGPLDIHSLGWEIPADWRGIDAATACVRGQGADQRICLFRGTEYVSLDRRGRQVKRETIAVGWPGLPDDFTSGLDTVLTMDWLPIPYAYFVKGNRCVRWNLKDDHVAETMDLKTAFPGLPAPFTGGFDTAVATPGAQQLGNRAGGIYFFRQGQYCHLSKRTLLPCDCQDTDTANCDIRAGWPGAFVKRDGGLAGLVRVSSDTCDIAMGWVNFENQIEWNPTRVYQVYNLDKPLPDTSILQLWSDNGITAGRRYSRAGADGYKVTWSGSLHVASDSTGWLPVTRDDQTDILQFRDKNGQLTICSYVPDGTGGYTAGPASHDLGAPADATAWLPVERDGQLDVVQIWPVPGQDTMKMRTLTRAGNGTYTASSPTTYQHTFATALSWSVCRINNQTAGLVQAWDNGNGVAITMYTPDGRGGFVQGKTTTFGTNSDALGWVSAYSESRTYLVQFRRTSDFEVTAIVYVPDPATDTVTSSSQPMQGRLPGALAWLAVDTQGNGNHDIVQVIDAVTDDGRRQIALQMWGGPYDQSFPHCVIQSPMPQSPDGAFSWFTCTNAEQKSNIAGLWNNGGNLGIAIYAPSGERGAVEYHQDTAQPDFGKSASALAYFAVDDRL